MSDIKIILISGKAQNGKDTFAEIFMKKIKGETVRLAFADYLKYICEKYFGWDGRKSEAGRNLLQFVGTDLIRNGLGWQDFHVDRVCQDIKIAENKFDYFLVPDTRRENEIEVTKMNFPGKVITVRVNRLSFKSPLTEEQQRHISETGLDNYSFDYTIDVEDGLDNLEKEVDKFIDWMVSRDEKTKTVS